MQINLVKNNKSCQKYKYAKQPMALLHSHYAFNSKVLDLKVHDID